MPTEIPKQYWDSCVFLSYVNETAGRVDDVASLLEEAANRRIEIVTSVLTIAEVAFGAEEQTKKKLDPEIEKRINRLWEPASPVNLIEVYSTIAEDARALARSVIEKGWSLKGYDSLHLAAARRLGVTLFATYDDALLKYADVVGFPIEHPAVMAPRLGLTERAGPEVESTTDL